MLAISDDSASVNDLAKQVPSLLNSVGMVLNVFYHVAFQKMDPLNQAKHHQMFGKMRQATSIRVLVTILVVVPAAEALQSSMKML